MIRFTKHICLVVGLLLALAGCGVTTVGAGASNPGASSSTATAGAAPVTVTPVATPGSANTTPGTSTSGPIVIATNHASYAVSDTMQVTLTNSSATVIGAYNHQASCSIFALETQVNGAWQSVTKVQPALTACTQGQVTTMITVNSGGVYHANIQAGATGKTSGAFPPGQYRIRLTYTTTPSASQASNPVATDGNPAFTSLYSATLTVA